MHNTLIVVATNNGKEHLERLHASFERYGIPEGAKVLIVDTGSTSDSIEYIKSLPYAFALTLPIRDIGAYTYGLHFGSIYGFKNYLFMHDSMEVMQENWLEEFESRMTDELTIVPWLTFDFFFDSDEQVKYLEGSLSTYFNGYPEKAVFGPVFYTSSMCAHTIFRHCKFPETKIEAQAWERGIAIICKEELIKVNEIQHGFNVFTLDAGEYTVLRKYRPGRA